MSKNPSTTFYFNDWEDDKKLKLCSLAAQGLWMRLLCIAARSPERGVVQIEGLNSGLPEGLAHIALAVGRPPEEIAPLIDELISSGTADRDRKRRLVNRRMIAAAALSGKRAEVGRLGADVTNGKRERKPGLPQQTHRQTSAPSSLQDSRYSSHGDTMTEAPRASASPDGPPRTGLLTSDEKWTNRLLAYDPSRIRATWSPEWGLPPDSPGTGKLIPAHLVQWWKARRSEARQGEAA